MKRNGFTLIELLVVVAIIGILAAVGVVAYNGYMEGSKSSRVMSNCAEAHSFISSTLKYCEINPSVSIPLKSGSRLSFSKSGGVPDPKIENVSCNKTINPTRKMLTKIMNHLNNEGFVNPYGMVGGYDDGVVGPYPVCHPGSGKCYEDFLLKENKYQYQMLGKCMIQGDATGEGAVQGFYKPGTAKGMGCCSHTNEAKKWTSNKKFSDDR
tara:strand:+ start:70 stop:699 length:630 start_codon:yes stop_codon:yes gene_type:complete